MDIISIIAGILLPIAGWAIGRFFALEKKDSELSSTIDSVIKILSSLDKEIKELRKDVNNNNKRIYYIEKTQRERKCEGCKNV